MGLNKKGSEEMNLNRAQKRKIGTKIYDSVVDGKKKAVAKKQYGFGVVVTNLMIVVTFWRWTWVLMDRRLT